MTMSAAAKNRNPLNLVRYSAAGLAATGPPWYKARLL
jgi:hypothetical protein